MSMTICQSCGDALDSDLDPDCFVEAGGDFGTWEIVCESCREKVDQEQTEESINSEMRQEFKQANGRYLK